MKIFGREPALWLGMLAALLKLSTAFGFEANAAQQALINTFAAAVVAVVLALVAKQGAVAAAVLQAAQAGMALFVGFGLDWGAEKQAMVMGTVAAALSLYERTQIEAPVPPGIRAERTLLRPSGPRSA